MNKRVYTNTGVLIFLYAYSHQAALSLHRSNNAAWKEVRDFYNNRIKPERVGRYLSSLPGRPDILPVPPSQDTFFFSAGKRLVYRVWYTSFNRQYLLEEEMNYYIQLLNELQILLTKEEVDPYEVAHLGLKFSLFIGRHLRWRLRIKDQLVAMKIDHFFANEHLITMPLERFMTGLKF